MGTRGRPQSKRTSELGQYIQEQRDKCGWSMSRLALEARVPLKALSKLELARNLPRHPEIFLCKVALALDLHPNQLLLRASLTPMLRPSADAVTASTSQMLSVTFRVTEDERRQLDNYLQFVRQIASIDSLALTTLRELKK